jgi:hypothetical protein
MQVGVSADLDPNLLPMWEIRGGATDTWTSTAWQFNLYDVPGRALNKVLNWVIGG